MNKIVRVFSSCFFVVGLLVSANAQNTEKAYTLKEIVELAKTQSTLAKRYETTREVSMWGYREFRAQYNPQLSISGNLPSYNRTVIQNTLDNGEIVYQSREFINPNLRVFVEQPIALTGGTISLNSTLDQSKNYTFNNTNWSTTWANITIEQPLFAFNPLKWDKKIEPLLFEESKRAYAENMEQVAQRAVTLFFDLLGAQMDLQIAEFNKVNNDTIYLIAQGRYNIGTTTREDMLSARQTKLAADLSVTVAQNDLLNARRALRSFIGMQTDVNEEFRLVVPDDIPEMPNLTPEEALARARENRSDWISFERQRLEAQRNLIQAKRSRFNISLAGSYGWNKNGSVFDDLYRDPLDQQRANLALNFPILDVGRTKARVGRARANQELTEYTLIQDELDFEQEIITLVRSFAVRRQQILISQTADSVSQERYAVTRQRYSDGKVDLINYNQAQTQKDEARTNYINALRQFWSDYYLLRQLTLYDFVDNRRLYFQEED